jgi:ketosteroid isomerase-like protein
MRLLYALFLAILISSPLHAGDLKSEIAKQEEAFAKAYNAHDFKALGQMYAEDAVVYAQGVDITKGREAIQKLWASFEKDMSDMKLETLEVVDAGKHSIEYGKYTSTYQGKPDQGIYVTVRSKDSGKWKIVRDSWWSNPQAK